MTDQPVFLKQPFWSIDNASVDPLLEPPPRLEIHTKAAHNADGSTLAVAIGYGAGPDLDELYGAMLMAAVVVVAINLKTGAIHTRQIANAHAFPVSEFLPDAPPDAPQLDEGGENIAAERVGFDLVRYLGLPRDGARYALFAWLDRLVTDTVIVDMPRSPESADGPSPPVFTSDTEIQIEPAQAVADDGAKIDVQGITAVTSAQALGHSPFAVLAVDGATRRLFTASSAVAEPGGFRVDLTGFNRAREPSMLTSWVLVFDGQRALTPRAMPPRTASW